MIPYFSRTGGAVNLGLLRHAGWHLMLSPEGVWRTEDFPYCMDNGAWTAYKKGRALNLRKFYQCALRFGGAAEFVALPDIVMGGLGSLALSLEWINELPWCPRILIPVQNGMVAADVEPHLSARVGIFVGGDDEFKDSTMSSWGQLARKVGCYMHVGRVNTMRRIKTAQLAGADSIDGTCCTRFAVKNLPRLERQLGRPTLVLDTNP